MNLSKKIKMRPVVGDCWKLIGPRPESLGKQLPNLNEEPLRGWQPNDHAIFQGLDGCWHLWACVRQTSVGRLLCRWEAENLTDSPWRLCEDVIRADRSAGESRVDYLGQEFLQSPFVVRDRGLFYMFYGGYATGVDSDGNPDPDYPAMENQISLMTSPDGRNWTRFQNSEGLSRVFAGPGAARDEYVVRFGDTWYMYYTGHHDRSVENESIYVRTSSDLINWSDWALAHFADPEFRTHRTCESPVVVERGGYYYLFRSGGYDRPEGSTAVFRSDNPLDFGIGDPRDKYVCNIPAHASEIIVADDGREYISKIFEPETGYAIFLTDLHWETDE